MLQQWEAGRHEFAAGRAKNHKGGTFFKHNLICMPQPGSQTLNGGPGTTVPHAGDVLNSGRRKRRRQGVDHFRLAP